MVETIEPLGTMNERGVCEEEKAGAHSLPSLVHGSHRKYTAADDRSSSCSAVNGSCDQRHTQTAQQQM